MPKKTTKKGLAGNGRLLTRIPASLSSVIAMIKTKRVYNILVVYLSIRW
jgi:hypothetical protein